MKYSEQNKPIQCMMTNSTCYKGTRAMTVKGVLWHSTGANNPTLKRYVQPSSNDPNYTYLMNLIGKNTNGNDWNHIERQAGLNCWIGQLANGEVTTIQTMPWNYRPWGCGSGSKGTCNDGWIQFEICEDGLTDANYFNKVYKEACEITAYLCKMYNINPLGTVSHNGVIVPTILCHYDSYNLRLGSNHGDIYNWFPKFGKDMNSVRQDVYNIMQEDDEVTQEQFNQMMNTYLVNLAQQPPSSWSQEARNWCESKGIIQGDNKGNKMYKKYLSREEMAQVLYRTLKDKI